MQPAGFSFDAGYPAIVAINYLDTRNEPEHCVNKQG
jgi:hypothetical protein